MKYRAYFFRTLGIMVGFFIVTSMTINVMAVAGGHKQSSAATQAGDIVDVAVAAGTFDTLVAAAQAAELVDALKGDGPLTLFAPTDAAFAALPEGTVESLLQPENQAQLQAVLLYHVVAGKVTYADIKIGSINAETLQGGTVDITKSNGWTNRARTVTVNGANVVTADVSASNGVIHVIDAVLLPPEA
jgi:uncharacterized surface protein with fasciclin (FAS1) repeats